MTSQPALLAEGAEWGRVPGALTGLACCGLKEGTVEGRLELGQIQTESPTGLGHKYQSD